MTTRRDRMIIFDYSGTLSIGAVAFGRPEYLMEQLKRAGLDTLGITSPDMFWGAIVNPTWEEGSTTTRGYKALMRQKIGETCPEGARSISESELANAVSRFVDSYFNHSRIDKRWQPTLQALNKQSSAQVIIATDHYAEATDVIIRNLRDMRIVAISAKDAFDNPRRKSFFVANSADIGAHKADRRFWTPLKGRLLIDAVRQILVIDDFGYHEATGSQYSRRENVKSRKSETVRLLEAIFACEVTTVPFMIEKYSQRVPHYYYDHMDNHLGELIRRTTMVINTFLQR